MAGYALRIRSFPVHAECTWAIVVSYTIKALPYDEIQQLSADKQVLGAIVVMHKTELTVIHKYSWFAIAVAVCPEQADAHV